MLLSAPFPGLSHICSQCDLAASVLVHEISSGDGNFTGAAVQPHLHVLRAAVLVHETGRGAVAVGASDGRQLRAKRLCASGQDLLRALHA